jgi:hypothetical protein
MEGVAEQQLHKTGDLCLQRLIVARTDNDVSQSKGPSDVLAIRIVDLSLINCDQLFRPGNIFFGMSFVVSLGNSSCQVPDSLGAGRVGRDYKKAGP